MATRSSAIATGLDAGLAAGRGTASLSVDFGRGALVEPLTTARGGAGSPHEPQVGGPCPPAPEPGPPSDVPGEAGPCPVPPGSEEPLAGRGTGPLSVDFGRGAPVEPLPTARGGAGTPHEPQIGGPCPPAPEPGPPSDVPGEAGPCPVPPGSEEPLAGAPGVVIAGDRFDNIIFASRPAVVESLYGLGGNDTLHAAAGQQSVGDEDLLFGGAGDDRLYGTGGTGLVNAPQYAILFGDDGNDRLVSGDEAHGGEGDDEILIGNSDLSAALAAYGGAGDDRIEGLGGRLNISGDDGDDVFVQLSGAAPNDYVLFDGGSGDDRVEMDFALPPPQGDVHLYGNIGADTMLLRGVHASLHGGDGNDVLSADRGSWLRGMTGDDDLFGGGGDERLDGGTGGDGLHGKSGNDRLEGGSGHDYLNGGEGIDSLFGGAGMDALEGGLGIDRLYGGAGADRFIADGLTAQGVDRVMDFNFAEGDRIDLGAHLAGIDSDDPVADGYLRVGKAVLNGVTYASVEIDQDGPQHRIGHDFQRVMLVRTDDPEAFGQLEFWT